MCAEGKLKCIWESLKGEKKGMKMEHYGTAPSIIHLHGMCGCARSI